MRTFGRSIYWQGRQPQSAARLRAGARQGMARALLALGFSAFALAAGGRLARAETCTTQSGMSQPERDGLAGAASSLALKIQANDAAGLRAASDADVQKNFGGLQYMVATLAPKLAGGAPTVDQVYVLDASTSKRNPDGSALDAQFFCSLNHTTMEVDFNFHALPPGKYGFAMVNMSPTAGSATPSPWRLAFLLRQDPASKTQGGWLLAGFYPKPLTAAGHDGLWYWTQARQFARDKQRWNAWLYYQAAMTLLSPADFALSTHLDKLRTELSDAAPPELSDGISTDTPLVVKAANGAEYRFTGLGVEDSAGLSSLDLAAHLKLDPATPTSDAATASKRNSDAMSTLLAAYPELRKPFHGVVLYAEAPGQQPVSTELPMAEIK